MKKIMMMVLILMLAVVLPAQIAMAEENGPLAFRKGVYFGMTPDQVMQAEADYNQVEKDIWEHIWSMKYDLMSMYDKVDFYGYKVRPAYLFNNDQLKAAYFTSCDMSDEHYDSTVSVLTKIYGTGKTFNKEDFPRIEEAIENEFGSRRDAMVGLVWSNSDIIIYMLYQEDRPFDYALFCLNPTVDYSSLPVRDEYR